MEMRDYVRIHSTESDLDGRICRVIGISFDHPLGSHYILELPEPLEKKVLDGKIHMVEAITLTEHCMEAWKLEI